MPAAATCTCRRPTTSGDAKTRGAPAPRLRLPPAPDPLAAALESAADARTSSATTSSWLSLRRRARPGAQSRSSVAGTPAPPSPATGIPAAPRRARHPCPLCEPTSRAPAAPAGLFRRPLDPSPSPIVKAVTARTLPQAASLSPSAGHGGELFLISRSSH
ncbi:unnamed protein product [Urochloa humidicola]